MVLRDGSRPVLEGLAMGVFIGLAGRAIVRARLQIDLPIVDPWMLIGVPIPLVVAAFCACYFPARRASRVEPNAALREL
jgi:putative ABC transport system permease protein